MKTRSTKISIVIPLFNEEESLRELHDRVDSVCRKNNFNYEIIFVNDGSSDGSANVLNELAKRNRRVKVIHFRRNFGKSAALDAGFRRASGERIITMDADLQDDPAEIPALMAALDEGSDLVSGWKKERHDSFDKTAPSKLFNFVVGLLSGISLHDFNCGLKAYRREALEGFHLYGEMHRFIPVLLFWKGFRVSEITVRHHARKYGVSKFGFSRLFKGFLDLLTVLFRTRFARRPLHLFGFTGGILGISGFVILLYLTIIWFQGMRPIGNRPLLFVGILLILAGIQLVSTGLLAELIISSQRTGDDYSIKEISGTDVR